MKKISLLITISFLALFSCTTDSSKNNGEIETSQDVNLDMESLVVEYNLENNEYLPKASYYEENIDFGINDTQLMLLIGAEGDYKTSFKILMDRDDLKKFESMKSGKYEVAYLYDDLFLKKDNGEIFYFTVNDNPAYSDKIEGMQTSSVIGLVNFSGFDKSNSKSMIFRESDVSCTCVSIYDQNPPSCSSGGEGSSSCSTSDGEDSCSVSCSSGYFACCNL